MYTYMSAFLYSLIWAVFYNRPKIFRIRRGCHEKYRNQARVAMGGRAAEELIFGKDKITGGASGDLQSASNVSEYMVKKLGMSEKVGLRIYNDRENDNQSSTSKEVSGAADMTVKYIALIQMIDAEINQLLNESYKRSLNILMTHKKELHLLAGKETYRSSR